MNSRIKMIRTKNDMTQDEFDMNHEAVCDAVESIVKG